MKDYKNYTTKLYLNDGTEIEKIHDFSKEDLKNIDCDRGNFHIVPEDVELRAECSKNIHDKLVNLRDLLRNKAKEDWYYTKLIGPRNKNYTDIFDYFLIKTEKLNYQVMGIRFYKSDDEKNVSCILQSYQIAGFPDIKSCELYPNSQGNCAYSSLSRIMFYYNLESSFETSLDLVADEIIKLIVDTEKKV